MGRKWIRNEKKRERRSKCIRKFPILCAIGKRESAIFWYDRQGERVSQVSNAEVLREFFQFYIENNAGVRVEQNDDGMEAYQQYLKSSKDDCLENICLISESSLKNLVAGVSEHGLRCNEKLDIESFNTFGHVQKLNLKCKEGHALKIDTSSKTSRRKTFGKFVCPAWHIFLGLRYAQYERFA